MILHNLCVHTWKDILSEAELQEVLVEEQMERKRTLNEGQRAVDVRRAMLR